MHRHNPLPPLLLIIQRNCRRHHHHQRRHRKEPPLQHHHYYCRRQHLLSKPSDIIFSNAPIFFRPIDKLLSQLHYDLFICIFLRHHHQPHHRQRPPLHRHYYYYYYCSSISNRLTNPTLRSSSARRQLFIFHLHYQSLEAPSVVIIINGIIGRSRHCSR